MEYHGRDDGREFHILCTEEEKERSFTNFNVVKGTVRSFSGEDRRVLEGR